MAKKTIRDMSSADKAKFRSECRKMLREIEAHGRRIDEFEARLKAAPGRLV
jgi:hypothetical protein